MSRYVSSYYDRRHARASMNGYRSVGLPDDEWRELGRAQGRERLKSHFEQHRNSSRSYQPTRSVYRDAGFSHSQRHGLSEVRSSTRAALGPNFDPFDNESYDRSCRRDDDYGRSRGWTDDTPRDNTIPKKCLDEYNQRWHEDDEDNDAGQYLADYASEASWRKHKRLDRRDHYMGEPSSHSYRPRTAATPPRRVDSACCGDDFERPQTRGQYEWPQLSSKFSFDDEVYEEPKPKGGFFNHFRRH